MKFEFTAPPKIIFGAGSTREVSALAKRFGDRALLVTGGNLRRAEKLLTELSAGDITTKIFQAHGEPEISTIEDGVVFAKKWNCDVVISFGGGSVVDAGKAIAAMLTNDGSLLDYLEIIGQGKPLTKSSAPFVAIPTTAGTGSEVTRNAVLASPEHKVKVSLRSRLMVPSVAVVDPELTYDLPPALTASTGLDALTQLIEPFVCLRANPLTDGFCVEGIALGARSLRAAFTDGRNQAAREDMAMASLFGGLALANAGLGAVHGFAGPIGGSFPAPHGAICAALLPHVMAMNIRALREREPRNPALHRYDRVAALLTGHPNATADVGVEWVRQLVADLHIPRLSVYGIKAEHVVGLVDNAARASSMKANPVALTPAELAGTLRLAL